MRTQVLHLDPDSPARDEARSMLKRLRDEPGADPALIEALTLVLQSAAAGHTVRITEESTFYTPAEAGRMLGVSRQYIDKMIARGELPATHKPGSSHRLVNADDIDAARAKRDERRRGVDAMVDTLLDGGAEY